MKKVGTAALVLLVLIGCSTTKTEPGTDTTQVAEPKLPDYTGKTIRSYDLDSNGRLIIDTEDTEATFDGALEVVVSQDKSVIYWTYSHGLAGYEGEGFGVMRYVAETNSAEVVFNDDLMLFELREAVSSSGRRALVMLGRDGGRGAPSLIVADPERGRTFYLLYTMIEDVSGGTISLATYTNKAIESYIAGDENVRSQKSVLSLDNLIDQPASRDPRIPNSP